VGSPGRQIPVRPIEQIIQRTVYLRQSKVNLDTLLALTVWRRRPLGGLRSHGRPVFAHRHPAHGRVHRQGVRSPGGAVGLLALALVVTSAIGLYGYRRVILTIARPPEAASGRGARADGGSRWGNLVLAALALGIFWLGVYPGPVLDLIQRTAAAVLPF
jgi:hypothetical protein